MIKKLAATLLCLAALVTLPACGSGNGTGSASASANSAASASAPEEQKLKVSVTFDAMKELVEAVGKDKVEISTIIPAGTEPHDFEPKAQDLVNLSTATVFVYNGLGMEGWAEEAISSANNPALVVVEASKDADVIERETADEDHHDEETEEDHDHGKYDPHLWLGLKGAQTEVKNIADALVQADPDNTAFYQQNCDEFIAQLEELYNEYSDKFQSVEKKNFVTGHAAFGYLCRDFGLEQNSIQDLFAEGEPSAQQLAELVEYCKEHEVTTIFAEEMVSTAISQTLANEVGAKVEVIYTMENAQDGLTYLERMESNLAKIYDSVAA